MISVQVRGKCFKLSVNSCRCKLYNCESQPVYFGSCGLITVSVTCGPLSSACMVVHVEWEWHCPVCVHICHCLCLLADQEYVEGYRVQIVSEATDTAERECDNRFGRDPKVVTDVAFDNKVSRSTALWRKLKLDIGCEVLHHVILFLISRTTWVWWLVEHKKLRNCFPFMTRSASLQLV